MTGRSWKLAALLSFGIFIVLLVTIFISGAVTMLFFHMGVFRMRRPEFMPVGFAIGSILIGVVLSRIGGRLMIAPIVEISEATKQIAKGDFDIHIKQRGNARELNVMVENFTNMARELSRTETMRNDFINNVSHEFKTPLSAIEGYATLLQGKSLSEEKREAYIAKILYNSRRLSSLTGNILLLSRLEQQEILDKRQPFSLDEQIRQIILLFESEWTGKGLELDIEMEEVVYNGNADLLAQVWQNLIGNAIKFVPEGGMIQVRLQSSADFVSALIYDTGIGMSQEVQERMFEKFYQGDSSHSTDGNGLGLTLVKRIIDLHGGRVFVRSREGLGSSFMVYLPVSMPGNRG